MSDEACAAINKHGKRDAFAKKLVQISKEPNEFQLDALITIGDLTASPEIEEKSFFVANDLFTILGSVLQSVMKPPKNVKKDPERNLKLKELIVWTISNGLADNNKCQALFMTEHQELLRKCLTMTGLSDQLNMEVCHMIDNILDIRKIKRYIFCDVTPTDCLSEGDELAKILASDRTPSKDPLNNTMNSG